MTGVYKITNILTGETYVGSSKNIEKRWKQHQMKSYWRRQPNNQMYQEMRLHGNGLFDFEIITLCNEENLKELEDYWIQKLNPAYNKNRAYIAPENRAKHHSELGCLYAERHKQDEKEKERRNRNSRIWRARQKQKRSSN